MVDDGAVWRNSEEGTAVLTNIEYRSREFGIGDRESCGRCLAAFSCEIVRAFRRSCEFGNLLQTTTLPSGTTEGRRSVSPLCVLGGFARESLFPSFPKRPKVAHHSSLWLPPFASFAVQIPLFRPDSRRWDWFTLTPKRLFRLHETYRFRAGRSLCTAKIDTTCYFPAL